jgi:putative ABC transport system permease protein
VTRGPGSWLVDAASVLVPGYKRAQWRREWEAELAWAWQRRAGAGEPGLGARLRLWMRAASCLDDAIHERWEGMTMTGTTNDVRFALRGLLRNPAFTAIAVLTLALGIGANTAVFTLVDGVLLSPLPYPESDRLVSISHLGRDGQDVLPVSTGLYLLYREQVKSIAGIALHQQAGLNLALDGEEPLRVDGQSITPSFFDVLKVQPALGRAFNEEDAKFTGAPPTALILSDGLWRRAFGADPGVIGRSVVMSGTSRTVVGVMPPDFGYPTREMQFYVPLAIDEAQAPIANFSAGGIARLAPGATPESLQRELTGLIGRLAEFYPGNGQVTFLASVGLAVEVQDLKESIVGDVTRTLWILLGTVAFVLLIACANVANLFLVRAEGRHRELALRVALGAGRNAVIRPFLAEAGVLALLGGMAGVGVAAAAVRLTTALAPSDIPRLAEVGIDPRVLAFTAVASLLAAVLFGMMPVVRYGRADLSHQLKEGGDRGGTGGARRHRVRNALVVGQVALALVLLVGSGLMLRSFIALRSVDPGFDPEGVLTARLVVPNGEVPDNREVAGFFRQLIERLEAQPGVEAAGAVACLPLAGICGLGDVRIEDHPRSDDEMPIIAAQHSAEFGYFETLGIDLVEGRAFAPGDGADGLRAVVVSESFAKRWWPNASALGRRVTRGPEEWYEIVGVVADVHQEGLEVAPRDMVYFPAVVGPFPAPPGAPASQASPQPIASRALDVVVRVSGDPMSFLPVLRREVQELHPRIPVANPRTMADVFTTSTARASFTMVMLATAAGVALILGLVGIYGVISYVVSQRTREIGVRMALGASAPVVRGMVVRQGAALAVVGVVLGLIASAWLSRVMGSLLFGVSAKDPITYGGVATALVLVAVLASWLPARRAAGVDPAIALRND